MSIQELQQNTLNAIAEYEIANKHLEEAKQKNSIAFKAMQEAKAKLARAKQFIAMSDKELTMIEALKDRTEQTSKIDLILLAKYILEHEHFKVKEEVSQEDQNKTLMWFTSRELDYMGFFCDYINKKATIKEIALVMSVSISSVRSTFEMIRKKFKHPRVSTIYKIPKVEA